MVGLLAALAAVTAVRHQRLSWQHAVSCQADAIANDTEQGYITLVSLRRF